MPPVTRKLTLPFTLLVFVIGSACSSKGEALLPRVRQPAIFDAESVCAAPLPGPGVWDAAETPPRKECLPEFRDPSSAPPECADRPPSSPGSWTRTAVSEMFSLDLPNCFEVPIESNLYPHGGSRWQCSSVTVGLKWGMWMPGSFGSTKGCATRVGATTVIVMGQSDSNGTSVVAWYRTGQNLEPVVSSWSPRREDRELARQIALSGRIGNP